MKGLYMKNFELIENINNGALDQKLATLYDSLWRELHDWCLNNLKGEDLRYYIQTTD